MDFCHNECYNELYLTRKEVTDMKKYVTKISAVLLCLILLCTSVCVEGAEAGAASWRTAGGRWFRGDYEYRADGNKLIRHKISSIKKGRTTYATWKLKDGDYLSVTGARKNKVFASITNDSSDAKLYSVDLKMKKKKKLGNLWACAFSNKYFYTMRYKPTDVSTSQVTVYKLSGNSIKKGKKLGKHIFGVFPIGNKLYYGKYSSKNMKKVTVYRSNLNGSKPKKLFTVKGKNQVTVSSVLDKHILVTNDSTRYFYTIKTKKLTKTKI